MGARLRTVAGVSVAVGTLVLLASCATTSNPQQRFRTYFLPPAPAAVQVPETPAVAPIPAPPPLTPTLYADEIPTLSLSLPAVPQPSEAQVFIKRADDRFAAGKKAIEDGRLEDARNEFNRAVSILLAAPGNIPDRTRLEQRLEEMVDEIYRYDTDQLGAGDSGDDEVSYDKRPLDEILDMTFPVDPSLRNKVRAQVQATVSQLPLEEGDAVVSYINFFLSERGKKILEAGLRRSGRYRAMIERVLAEEGLPQELIFLAQAESGFMPRATSNKRCVGLWQFAKFRGEEYGLEVNSSVDARMDPERETRAAARHLHDLYLHLGDWYLAMAAYNCGPLCIDRAVQRTGYADFWKLRNMGALPRETANYVPAILAMVIISKNASDYGLNDVDLDPPVEYDSVEIQSPTNLALVAAAVDRPISELREMNPALLKTVAPAGYQLHVPRGTRNLLEDAFAVIPSNQRNAWRIHRVEGGDTLALLAKRYGTTVESIRSANRDQLPEAGMFAAIPVAYPGTRTSAVHKRIASRAAAHRTPSKTVSHRPTKRSVAVSRTRKKGPSPHTIARRGSSKANHRAPGA